MSEPVVDIRGVVKRFGSGDGAVAALDGLTISIAAGRVTGLVGPDGAGKTTLMRLIAGLLRPDEGTIQALGFDSAREAQQIQANVGYMPQRFGLYEDLSVDENLRLYADLHGLAGGDRAARFDRLMHFTGLGPFRSRLAGRLSGGMKQKLGLACTLVRPPRLLLLDEPSVGVDPVSRRELWDMVSELIGEGISVLWSTAYLDEAERCDEVILLSQGTLLGSGPPAELEQHAAGRTFAVAIEGIDKRAVLQSMSGAEGVVDAAIKGRELRLLLSEAAARGDVAALVRRITGVAGAMPRPTRAGFEDSFIALVKEQGAAAPAGDSGDGGVSAAPGGPAARPPSPSEPVIRVQGLVRTFGAFRAVDGIDFDVRPGEIFGLLGPNGAGKSTTFKILCGLLAPSQGTALVLGIDLRRAAAVARGRIGYMAQKFSLYGNMTVLQNLTFFASAYGLSGRAGREAIGRELAEFGLDPYAEANSADLPLGYKQRLALACAIMHRPGILFLDEPTAGVDPLVRREFWRRINAMAAAGVTVMVTTHFMEEAEYCDRVGIIYRGQMIAMGAPDDLKAEHATRDRPNPTLEDAFVDLIERHDREAPQ